MAEFPTDEHREAYLAGLQLERAGYEAKLGGADADAERALYERHISEVDAEYSRVSGVPVEKAERRPKTAPETR